MTTPTSPAHEYFGNFDALGTYDNVPHAIHNFAWSQLKKALDSLAATRETLSSLVIYRQEMEGLQKFTSSELDALKEAFPETKVPASVMETVHGLFKRRNLARAAIKECDTRLISVQQELHDARQNLAKARGQFRRTMIELAEVPEELRATARCRIVDMCSGESKVYFGTDNTGDSRLGCRLVRPHGAVEHIREPTLTSS